MRKWVSIAFESTQYKIIINTSRTLFANYKTVYARNVAVRIFMWLRCGNRSGTLLRGVLWLWANEKPQNTHAMYVFNAQIHWKARYHNMWVRLLKIYTIRFNGKIRGVTPMNLKKIKGTKKELNFKKMPLLIWLKKIILAWCNTKSL